MKRDTVNYVMVGAFVVTMAIAFLVLMMAVTGRSGPTDNYHVYYNNVGGLKFGTAVLYEGYRVGQIEKITPERDADGMRYRVDLSVESGWAIPADSIARVQSSGLISAITIHINEGQASELLAPGSAIAGEDKTDLFAVLDRAASDFHRLSEDGVMPLLGNLNLRVTELADEIIRFRRDDLTPFVRMMHERIDQDLVNEAVELINHLDSSAQGLKAMVDSGNQQRVREFLEHINHVASNLNDLVGRIENTRQQMNGVLGSIGDLVDDNAAGVKGTVGAAETSMEELDIALKTVNQHLGTILYDIEGSARHMGEFARVIRENPSRLLRNSSTDEPGGE